MRPATWLENLEKSVRGSNLITLIILAHIEKEQLLRFVTEVFAGTDKAWLTDTLTRAFNGENNSLNPYLLFHLLQFARDGFPFEDTAYYRAGYPKPLDDRDTSCVPVAELKTAGVTVEYLAAATASGMKYYDDIIRAFKEGTPVEYLRAAA